MNRYQILVSFLLIYNLNGVSQGYSRIRPEETEVHPVIGIAMSSSGVKSTWLTLGNDFFFIYQLGFNSTQDLTVYHPLLDSTETIVWNDERYPDIIKQLKWSVGVGSVLNKRSAVFISAAITKIDIRYQFKDETYTLSRRNGLYSYPRKTEGGVSCDVGVMFKISKKIKNKISTTLLKKPLKEFEIGIGMNLYK